MLQVGDKITGADSARGPIDERGKGIGINVGGAPVAHHHRGGSAATEIFCLGKEWNGQRLRRGRNGNRGRRTDDGRTEPAPRAR